nr:SWI/SNF chromatin-remodeling complex subunit [Polyrhizophydium stewartii]
MASEQTDAGPPDDPDDPFSVYRKREHAHKLFLAASAKRHEQLYYLKKLEQHKIMEWSEEMKRLARRDPHHFRSLVRPPIFTDEQLESAGEMENALVPVRLDIEMDGFRLRDTFTWNLRDTIVTPEMFARILRSDLRLPESFEAGIVKSIKEQLDDFFQHAPSSLVSIESETRGNDGEDPEDKDLPELRTVIKLDILVDDQAMVDQFEWDIGCRRNNPELFAEHVVTELGLVPEFKTAIAHAIREQVQMLSKSLLLIDYKFDGGNVDDEELAAYFLPTVHPKRTHRTIKDRNEFGPFLNYTNAAEVDRLEKEHERDSNKRKRRQTQRSRRLVTLPERDQMPKTNRTPVPYPFRFASKPVIDVTFSSARQPAADGPGVVAAGAAAYGGANGTGALGTPAHHGAGSAMPGLGTPLTARRE